MEDDKQWLPHLSSKFVSDAHGNLLDAYAVSLEGWRRGLKLRWHVKDSEKFAEMTTWFVDRPGQLFSLSSKDKTHYFFRTRGDLVSNEAVAIGRDKEKTKEVLNKAGIPVPEGRRFTETEANEEIIKYANALGYPVVLKPTDGSFGKGVIANITSSGELEYSLEYVRSDLNFRDVILERFVTGDDYRIYVVDDQVVGAIKRIPPNVTGDGVNTIRALIQLKNEERSLNPRLISCPIEINQELTNFIGRKGYTLDSILSQNEPLFLSSISNVSLGGDPVDVLDELPEQVKRNAVNAIKAVPGLIHAAVDIMYDENSPNSTSGTVIELNPTAQLGGILYPVKGKSRDVPAAIIDYYFPETKGVLENKGKTYFDFHDVLDPLNSRQGYITTVTPSPVGKLYAKKYTVSGDVQDIGYHRGLRKQAFERYLHGFVSNLEDGDIEVIVAGTDEEMVNDFRNGLTEDTERATVLEIQEEIYEEPIKVGFEIKADLKTQLDELKLILQELEVTELALKKAEVQNRKFEQSLSWKISKPVRLAGTLLKKFK
ncbi:acylphosphatase [Paucisalibacillus sp. EB02]|uniref:acylphosphatase n=1 Tax=Paucisalibacillus sp. EB02 TaxID=1347087 RepID=UPI0004B5B496|nr:acylphosphatase [Paucisalibacillus sp. EB02]